MGFGYFGDKFGPLYQKLNSVFVDNGFEAKYSKFNKKIDKNELPFLSLLLIELCEYLLDEIINQKSNPQKSSKINQSESFS